VEFSGGIVNVMSEAGKTRARWRARPSKIRGNYAQAIRVVNRGLTLLVPSVAYAADPEVLVAHRGSPGRNRWS
jgi:hypothetical protein